MKKVIGLLATYSLVGILTGCTGEGRVGPVELKVESEKPLSSSVQSVSTSSIPADIELHPARMYIQSLIERGVTEGDSYGMIRPDDTITRAEAAALIHRNFETITEWVAPTYSKYYDIDETAWYADDVEWVYRASLMRGTGNVPEGSLFSPNDNMSKQQLAVIMHNWFRANTYDRLLEDMGGKPGDTKDIDTVSTWAKEAVEYCNKANMLAVDTHGMFNPAEDATRAEFAEMLCKANYLIDDYLAHTI